MPEETSEGSTTIEGCLGELPLSHYVSEIRKARLACLKMACDVTQLSPGNVTQPILDRAKRFEIYILTGKETQNG